VSVRAISEEDKGVVAVDAGGRLTFNLNKGSPAVHDLLSERGAGTFPLIGFFQKYAEHQPPMLVIRERNVRDVAV
jgi:hypothetical protein